LVAGVSGGWVKVWDCAGSRRPVASVHGHPVAGGVLTVQEGWGGGGADLYTQGRDGRVGLWDAGRGGGLEACGGFQTHQISFCAMGVLPARGLVACAGRELGVAEVWDARSGTMARTVHLGGAKGGMCMAAALYEGEGDGRAMGVFGWEDGSVAWIDVGEGRVVHRTDPLDALGESVVSLALCRWGSGDPGRVARDAKGRCWGAAGTTGGRVALFTFGDGEAGGGGGGQEEEADGAVGEGAGGAAAGLRVKLKSLLAPENQAEARGVGGVALRPDAKLLATAGWDGRVRLYSVRRPRPVAVLKYHTGAAHCVAFAACNAVGTADEDEDLDVDRGVSRGFAGAGIGQSEGESGRLGRPQRLMASAGSDSTIALWDLF